MKTTLEIKILLLNHFGTMLELSKKLKITPQRIFHWVNRDVRIPNEYMLRIIDLSDGKIKIEDLMKGNPKNAL
jgi:hypothetical protein